MKRVSIKNMSLLGLILMAASAVTAAVLPDKSESKRANNGTLRNFSASAGVNGVWSCIDDADTVDSCTATASTTTGAEQDDSTVNGLQTQGNTSQTAGQAGDQNSVLAQP